MPTAPTPVTPAVTVLRLTITPVGGGSILAGRTTEITSSGPLPSTGAMLGAFAQYTDGSGKYLEAEWTSSDPNVLIVSDGLMRAIARGTVTLTARAEGHTASETFTVLPGIAGTFAGTYVVDECVAGSGSMQELICNSTPGGRQGLLRPGTVAPIGFHITQTGTDLSATATFGDVRGTLIGVDRGQNYLTLNGELTSNGTTFKVTHWDARVDTDRMEGFIGFEVRTAGLPSHARVTAHFVDVTRR